MKSIIAEAVGTVGKTKCFPSGGGSRVATSMGAAVPIVSLRLDSLEIDSGGLYERRIARERQAMDRQAAPHSCLVSLLQGETSVQEAARKHGLTVAQVEAWREQFLLGAENALRSRPREEEALQEEQIKKLKQKVGELVLDLDIYKEAMRGHPFGCKILDEL